MSDIQYDAAIAAATLIVNEIDLTACKAQLLPRLAAVILEAIKASELLQKDPERN